MTASISRLPWRYDHFIMSPLSNLLRLLSSKILFPLHSHPPPHTHTYTRTYTHLPPLSLSFFFFISSRGTGSCVHHDVWFFTREHDYSFHPSQTMDRPSLDDRPVIRPSLPLGLEKGKKKSMWPILSEKFVPIRKQAPPPPPLTLPLPVPTGLVYPPPPILICRHLLSSQPSPSAERGDCAGGWGGLWEGPTRPINLWNESFVPSLFFAVGNIH